MPRSLSVAVAVGVVLLTTGCQPAPTPVAPIAAPSASATTDDPPGTLTCHLLVAAVTGGKLMEPGVVDGIVAASATADAPLADAARRLATAYTTAMAAKGAGNEPDAVAAVSAAGVDMAGVCDDSGLETVG